MLRRIISPIAVLTLLPLTATLLPAVTAASTTAAVAEAAVEPGQGKVQRASKKARYRAKIRQTKHGIPHITGKNFGDIGYGSGYMAADATACTLFDTLITGRGERSLWFGPNARYDDQVTLEASNLQVDAFVTDLHNRKVVETLLKDATRGPGAQARAMVKGYVAGANRWLREAQRKGGVSDPECKNATYLKNNAKGLGKIKPIDLWYGVYLANLLASSGVFVKEIVDASPPTPTDPGVDPGDLPLKAADLTAAEKAQILKGLGRDPERPFGSNATAVGGGKSTTGRGMLLGNPHFPWRGRYHFSQQHLTIPGKYDVAGASLVGSPVVNIGWNKHVAWSHTVSTAYRFTPYEYTLVGPTTYLTESGPQAMDHRLVKVKVRKADGSIGTVTEDMWRTHEGYVLEAPAVLMLWNPASAWALRDANAEHLRTIDVFLEMGKARNVRDLLARQDRAAGMPWVNTTAADRFGDALYADHSVVPNVSNAMAEQCMTVIGRVLFELAGLPGLNGTGAQSTCEWGTDADASRPGIFGPKNLPAVVRRDYVMNANDSYWTPNASVRLEGFARIIGCEQCERTMRTRMVTQYVVDRLAKRGLESPRSLRRHEHDNRMRAAEVMSAGGDLDTLCAATGETKACAVLKAWDRRSRRSSVGTHIFEEFIKRAPADQLWEVPFDADDPFNTPRDLDESNTEVQAAMQAAIDAIRAEKVRFNAPWGSLQVAGDRGASPIGLGGGMGDAAGNANALASYLPKQNADRYKPITYGSSHIQAISFHNKGRVKARTILTYSQYENPRSRWSQDQTKLFGKGKWVRFPFTSSEIAGQLVRKFTLIG
ncbi:penicillin acylase family protein [Nocardioides sp.]|uniref:penicillin acylase family protein n=1 Tax=Nocardioides sp. TaxID=35761 RepID=UPI003568F703